LKSRNKELKNTKTSERLNHKQKSIEGITQKKKEKDMARISSDWTTQQRTKEQIEKIFDEDYPSGFGIIQIANVNRSNRTVDRHFLLRLFSLLNCWQWNLWHSRAAIHFRMNNILRRESRTITFGLRTFEEIALRD